MGIKILFIFILICNSTFSFAQRPDAEIFKTKNGDLVIQPILHGTLALQFNGKTIYVDPYGGVEAFSNIDSPNIILITDIHSDHLDISTLNAINTNSIKFIVPQEVANNLPQKFHKNIMILKNEETTKQNDITIKAIPMYNLPESPDSFHTKGRGNGYILTFGGINIYISGDTEDIAEMRALKNIDIAFVCMNLPYTMEISQAVDAVLKFQPKIVYPYHYRGKPSMSDTKLFKKMMNKKNPDIEVRLRNWYPEYE